MPTSTLPETPVLMAEGDEESTYIAHHKQKIVLVISAMRYFAAELRQSGVMVDYVRLDESPPTRGASLAS